MKKLFWTISMMWLLPALMMAQSTRPAVIGKTFSSEVATEGALIYLQRANSLIEQFNVEDALLEYNNAVAFYPNDAMGYVHRADLLRRLGRHTEAEADIRKSRRLNPYAVELFGLSGPAGQLSVMAYAPGPVSAQTLPELEAALREYKAFTPSNKAEEIENWISMGIAHRSLGDYTEAQIYLDKALAEAPNDPIAMTNRADLFLIEGALTDAIYFYTKAVQLDDNLGEAYYNRGIAHILNYDLVSGCADLAESHLHNGYENSKEIEKYFCVH